MWPDNETELDFLNFSGVADSVTEIVVQAGRRPISIGVSGAWGAGTSSMIKLKQAPLGAHPREQDKREIAFASLTPGFIRAMTTCVQN